MSENECFRKALNVLAREMLKGEFHPIDGFGKNKHSSDNYQP